MLPHLGSASHETHIAIGMRRVLDSVTAFFDGATPPGMVV